MPDQTSLNHLEDSARRDIETDIRNLDIHALIEGGADTSVSSIAWQAARQMQSAWDFNESLDFQQRWGRQLLYIAKLRLSALINMESKWVLMLLKNKFPVLTDLAPQDEMYYVLWGYYLAYSDRVDLIPGGPQAFAAERSFEYRSKRKRFF